MAAFGGFPKSFNLLDLESTREDAARWTGGPTGESVATARLNLSQTRCPVRELQCSAGQARVA
jgi:hypothetical protein